MPKKHVSQNEGFDNLLPEQNALLDLMKLTDLESTTKEDLLNNLIEATRLMYKYQNMANTLNGVINVAAKRAQTKKGKK